MRARSLAKKKTTKKKVSKKKKTTTSTSSGRGSNASRASKTKKKTAPTKSTKKKATSPPTKKKVTKKKVTKTTTKKKVSKAAKKTTAKKTAAKKKTTAKKVTKKKISKKKVTKKKVTKKKAPAPRKVSSKKASTSKPGNPKTAKKTTKKKTTNKKTSPSKPAAAPSKGTATGPGAKPAENRRRRSPKSKKPVLVMPNRPLLLGPDGPALKPLIPSGTRAPQEQSVLDNVTSRRKKTPLTKAQLEHYRHILLTKRAELLGDMRHLEDEALRGESGRSNASSQHIADQGSDSYEQLLNLNLAASDRERINEIDAALTRIADRTYGLCEMTFEPIKRARLDELPWARYTIEAARELDRRGGAKR